MQKKAVSINEIVFFAGNAGGRKNKMDAQGASAGTHGVGSRCTQSHGWLRTRSS
jgi:hypothetical protein